MAASRLFAIALSCEGPESVLGVSVRFSGLVSKNASRWDRFRRFADPHFLTEVRRGFHPRFWEMYLTCALQEFANQQGSILSCPKPGPDILLERDGSRVWVEAVVATNGIPGRPDSVAEPNPAGSGKTPEEKLVLRYANAPDWRGSTGHILA